MSSNINISSLEDDLRRLKLKGEKLETETAKLETKVQPAKKQNFSLEAEDTPKSPSKVAAPTVQETSTISISSPAKSTVSWNFEEVCQQLRAKEFKNIIVLVGAGISVAAGIPDFRSPGTGLYDNLQKYNLPTPQSIFTLDFFRTNPKPFFTLAKEMYPGNYKPTKCHHFIKFLQEKGWLLRCFTQNIDGLERVAGIPEEYLVEAHGSFSEAHCIDCKKSFESSQIRKTILNDDIPYCTCGGLIKPDIVFFGESLPSLFSQRLSDFSTCDLLIVMGTSLQVAPFADLVDLVRSSVPRILINREKAGKFASEEGSSRNICLLGDCQDSVQKLVEGSGFKHDFWECSRKLF